ncbi:biotin transporter BioY [Radiobacillus sp. PE A8.2]|uniref:biotin transporter BioY n=1 Tax=Radiobacillus sp. PE A8.2 TaxID=3380349 RepID=UPI0038907FC5
MNRLKPIDITIGALFIGLMAIGANIAIWFPFLAIPIGGKTVPLSLQTFFAILAGLMLGKRLGSLSIVAYLLVGIAGVPVFAQMRAGIFTIFDYTGGFLISFIFVAFVTGWLAEKSRTKSLPFYVLASIVGVVVNYLIGVNYMYIAMNTWLELHISFTTAWATMIPFLIKDLAIAIIAAFITLNLSKRIPRFHRLTSNSM